MEQKFITITLKIGGMTCASCESRIERVLKNTAGIANAIVSYGNGTAIVAYNSEQITLGEIRKLIRTLGYEAERNHGNDKMDTTGYGLRTAGIIVVLLVCFTILNHFGGLRVFSCFPQAREGMGYGMLFIIGLLTSVHCVAMCGGINLSQCVPRTNKSTGKTNASSFRPGLLYNAGRVISYTVLGGLVGALGSVVSFSPALKGAIVVTAGIFMIIMGLNMMNLFPWLRKFNPRIPGIFAEKINNQKRGDRPFYVGLLNGLMPCGPLQAMQLFALSTGSPGKGALSMLLFSLGTVPLMFGLGAAGTLLTKKYTSKMMTASAALVVILGMFMLSSGLALSGYALPDYPLSADGNSVDVLTLNPTPGAVREIRGAAAEPSDGVQLVTSGLNASGYEPIVVQKGVPVQWNLQVKAGDLTGCNNSIVIPEYGIEKQLQPGNNLIEFTPEERGVVPFSCWMGMIQSRITVVEDISAPVPVPSQNEPPDSRLPSCCGG